MTKDYVALKIRSVNGRPLWRLYAVKSNRDVLACCPLGDYIGHPGASGLGKILSSLSRRGAVSVSRIVRGQVCFRVAR